jgi:hypothetical protein
MTDPNSSWSTYTASGSDGNMKEKKRCLMAMFDTLETIKTDEGYVATRTSKYRARSLESLLQSSLVAGDFNRNFYQANDTSYHHRVAAE